MPIGGRVTVLTHAAPINVYLSMMLGLSADMFFLPIPAALNIVQFSAGRYTLQALNESGHLATALAGLELQLELSQASVRNGSPLPVQ